MILHWPRPWLFLTRRKFGSSLPFSFLPSTFSKESLKPTFVQHLAKLCQEYESLRESMHSESATCGSIKKDQSLFKRVAWLKDVSLKCEELKRLQELECELLELLRAEQAAETNSGHEMGDLLLEELRELGAKKDKLMIRLRNLFVPKDELDDSNVMMEIHAGTGGQEAAIFVKEMAELYEKYCRNTRGWKFSVIEESPSDDCGGFKEIVAEICGCGAYERLKFESGVHRVQRVPSTESQGRVHTSTIKVAVLPQTQSFLDVSIAEKDLRIDTFRSSGPGGQHVNKTDSAVRITHLPSGIVVACQADRSQHSNKALAMQMLRVKLRRSEMQKFNDKLQSERRLLIGTGNRSEKIRTYNFPQSRITDHRIGMSLHDMDKFWNCSFVSASVGALEDPSIMRTETPLDLLINALAEEERAAQLNQFELSLAASK